MMIYLWGKNRHRRKPIQLLISIQLSTEKLCTMDVFLKLPEIKMSSYGPVGWNQQPAEPQMQNHWRMFHGGVSLGVQLAYIY